MIDKSIIENAELVIYDKDGVLTEEGKLIPDAIDLVHYFREKGKKQVVFTNNSTNHPDKVMGQLRDMGILVDGIMSSSLITAEYCKAAALKSVYIVGEEGLYQVFREEGFDIVEDDPDAVVVGMDRHLTYEKLVIATRAILGGSRFICTNPDPSYPTPRGLEPGAGSMIAALAASTGQKPEIIAGKPAATGYEFLMNKYGVTSEKTIMIGDRFETDILGALKLGITGIVVKTGVAKTRSNPGRYGEYEAPVIQSLSDLII